jgi:rhodanese-related sulfurtransferase
VQATAVYNFLLTDPQTIKKAAADRAKKLRLPYAGALLPSEAHELAKSGAKIVDVRTQPELNYVGRIPGSLAVEWQTYPGNKPNPEFIGELAASAGKDETLLLIARGGARPLAGGDAATKAGWKESYNVLEGFEGDKDAQGHRNSVGGWRVAGLPWTQS